MAHKTLVNSTAYEITGGVTLVSGTSYQIDNGKVMIGSTAYDISFLLPPAALDVWSGTASSIKCIAYANGHWVMGGTCMEDRSQYARIAYATSLSGPWTIKNLWAYNGSVNTITYADGYWVAGGEYSRNTDTYLCIAYSTSLSGTWTQKDVAIGYGNAGSLNCIIYAGGYWVVGGNQYTNSTYYACVVYATSLSGPWTEIDLWSGSGGTVVNCIAYADNYWVVGGQYYSGSTRYARIAYTTSLNGTWTTKNLWSSESTNPIFCITYANNYWVVGGCCLEGATYHARIAYATRPTGTWTMKNLWSSSKSNNQINCITYADGYWAVSGRYYGSNDSVEYLRIAYATSLSGTWTTKNLWRSASTFDDVDCIVNGDNYWVVGGCYYNGSTYYARIAYAASFIDFDKI